MLPWARLEAEGNKSSRKLGICCLYWRDWKQKATKVAENQEIVASIGEMESRRQQKQLKTGK